MKTTVLDAQVEQNKITVKSPGIGRVRMLVSIGAPVGAGQVVAEFYQLSQKRLLTLPNVNGVVTALKNHDAEMLVNYGEPFLFVDSRVTTATDGVVASTHADSDLFIDSPMDGMLYLAASPKDAPFVTVGDEIIPGQTIGLIEVMKSFYPLKYQGTKVAKITDVMVKHATPIKFGMKLFSMVHKN